MDINTLSHKVNDTLKINLPQNTQRLNDDIEDSSPCSNTCGPILLYKA